MKHLAIALLLIFAVCGSALVAGVIDDKRVAEADYQSFAGIYALRGLSRLAGRDVFDRRVHEIEAAEGISEPRARKRVLIIAREGK